MKSQWGETSDTRLFIESVNQGSITPEQDQVDKTRMAVLGNITKIYQMLMPFLFVTAVLGFGLLAGHAIKI